MSVFSGGLHPEERYPLNKAAQATAEAIDEAIRRGVAMYGPAALDALDRARPGHGGKL